MPKLPPRRLFLDDDPERASAFLKANPDAVWVQTVPDCLEKLAEPWDEIHLDHDLGGEHYVETAREDCGMEVVRWLGQEPRRHLRRARFTVHSHNMMAAFEMTYRIKGLGYQVEARPFGIEPPPPEPSPTTPLLAQLRARFHTMIGRLRGIDPLPDPGPIDADSPDYVP